MNETISNVQVSFHNVTWDTQENGNTFVHDPSINLLCSFDPSDDDTLLYHIDWYVDNDTVIQGQTVEKGSLQDAILSAGDMNKAGKKVNSWVSYRVLSQPSTLFFIQKYFINHIKHCKNSTQTYLTFD